MWFRGISIAGLLLAVGCGGATKQPPLPRPSPDPLLKKLKAQNTAVKSYVAESTMDFWTGDERIRATVLVMGKVGSKIRFNALNPDGGSTAVDLACDGEAFRFVDYNKNCFLEGPCNKRSVAQLLRIELHPDEFRHLVFGGAPLLPTSNAQVVWDEKLGKETLVLRNSNLVQTLVLELNGDSVDILQSTTKELDQTTWELTHKEFENQQGFRAPKKGRISQPNVDSDLIVSWSERKLNPTLPDSSFELEIPAGLPLCQ